MTVNDIVTKALQRLGVLAEGEVPSYDMSNDGLIALNSLMDQWAAERLQIFTVTRTTWTISGSIPYTVGTGGTINIARPVYIDHVNFIDTVPNPDIEYSMQPLTDDAFAAVTIKGLASTLPVYWYYNPTYPLGTLTLYPIPTQSGLQGVIYAPTAVTEFAALTTTVSLPPGYRRMLINNLAIELSSDYEKPVPPGVARAAADSLATVKRANIHPLDLSFEPASLVSTSYPNWSIRTGP